MYYSESEALITNSPLDKNDLILMDRAIARSYTPDGFGWLDDGIVQQRTKIDAARLTGLMRRYRTKRVVENFDPLECPNGHLFDPDETECPECKEVAANATPSGLTRYWVKKPPQKPLFDPLTAHGPFGVMISYRCNETERLAAELYYSLKQRGIHAFVDGGDIAPSVDFEKVFLPVASETPHLIALISRGYFGSDYCEKEIAHALRCGRHVLLVPVGIPFNAPRNMAWLVNVNPLHIMGSSDGLSPELENHLISQISGPVPSLAISDHRLDACRFLLAKLSFTDLAQLLTTFGLLGDLPNTLDNGQRIQALLQNVGTNETRIRMLCAALAPQ